MSFGAILKFLFTFTPQKAVGGMEIKRLTNKLDPATWLLFCVGSFLFFELNYSYWYRFMEQFMMFQTTSGYLNARLAEPGGIGEYVAEFLTLAFTHSCGASLVITLLLGAITVCFYFYLRACQTEALMWVAVLPAFLFWWFPQESIFPLLVLLVSLLFAWGYVSVRQEIARYVVGVLGLTIAYFFFAPANLLLALWIILFECFTKKESTRFIVSIVALAWALLLPLIAMRTVFVLPMREAFFSKYLCHPEYPMPASLGWIAMVYPIVAVFAYVLRERVFIRRDVWRIAIIYVGLVGVMVYCVLCRTSLMEQAYRYDYYARQGEWQKIIDHAREHPVKDTDALIYLNLALSHTDKLSTELLRSRQIGVDGFIPNDPKTRLGLIEACEVAWQVGHVNSAQRFAFVGVLSSQRCVQPRLMKQLVDIFLVLGEYRAAEKYIKMLEATPNYSKWANERRSLLDPEVCSSTDWVKAKRAVLPATDNPYDLTKVFPEVLAYLLDDHIDNRAAFDYGMSYLLVYKNLGAFMHYMEIMRDRGESFSVLYQEAICLYFSTIGKNFEQQFRTYPISQEVLNRFNRFIQQASSMPSAVLKDQFGDTYYYYAQFIQAPKERQ